MAEDIIGLSNRQVVARLYEAFRLRDMATVLGRVAPDVQITQTGLLPWGGQFEGHAGLERFLGLLLSHLDARLEVEDWIEAGDQVVAVGRTRGTLRESGAPFDLKFVHVWRLVEGRATSFQPFIDARAMLELLDRS